MITIRPTSCWWYVDIVIFGIICSCDVQQLHFNFKFMGFKAWISVQACQNLVGTLDYFENIPFWISCYDLSCDEGYEHVCHDKIKKWSHQFCEQWNLLFLTIWSPRWLANSAMLRSSIVKIVYHRDRHILWL